MGSAKAPVPQLVRALRHERHDVRGAAAAGLLAVGPQVQAALDALRGAREDVDTRVRWRAVAAMALAGDADVDLSEIRRAIDGPSDEDRLLVFEAIRDLGPKAASLADALEPWGKLPLPRLAEPAQRTLAAVLPGTGGARDG
jgi:HEAT repeat protein